MKIRSAATLVATSLSLMLTFHSAPAQAGATVAAGPSPAKASGQAAGRSLVRGAGAGTFRIPDQRVELADGKTYFLTGEVTVRHTTAGRAASGCSTASGWVGLKNVTGSLLWKYNQSDNWCYNGRVTSIGNPATIWGTVYSWAAVLGWEYKGIRAQRVVDYYGDKWVYDVWTQGQFSYCPPRVVCIQQKYPQLGYYLYGDGHWDFWYSV